MVTEWTGPRLFGRRGLVDKTIVLSDGRVYSLKSNMQLCQILAMGLSLGTQPPTLPTPDAVDLRRKTLNQHGYAETQFNETQLKFITYSASRARYLQRKRRSFQPQRMAFEIGMAFGDLGKEILKRGAYYFGTDMEPSHVYLATGQFQDMHTKPSQFLTAAVRFPIDPTDDQWREIWTTNQRAFQVETIGMFSVAMYQSGPEFVETLRWAYEALAPGGRFYLTAISPYTELFPGWESEYQRRHEYFLANKDREDYFPGWIPDVRVPEMEAHLPPNYLQMYPSHFHVWHPDVLEHYAEKAGFRVNRWEPRFLHRAHPERLRYRGSTPHVGELASMILIKPVLPRHRSRRD